jgi:AICAR transformylase/IMP cyclohydrolase PurH
VSACPSRSWTGRTERVAASDEAARVLSGLRHGMNPHQAARASVRHASLPVRVISGDALLGLATVRYTQSSSVALVAGGATLGIGTGQQNRVDCVRLAATKAATWWLRRHPRIDGLPAADRMSRQDRAPATW